MAATTTTTATTATHRIASFDFGPVHTSLCLVDACISTGEIVCIREWKVFDWRQLMLCGVGSSTAEVASAHRPIDSMTMAELHEMCVKWNAPFPGDRTEVKVRRPELVRHVKKTRDRVCPKIKETFYRSYDKYTEMVFTQLNAALQLDDPDAPLDAVLFEHQPAHFRYENAVVESMIAQHIFTMTRLPTRTVAPAVLHFLHPAFKFKAFLATAPKPKTAAGNKRKRSGARTTTQHSLNKNYSISCCRTFLWDCAAHALSETMSSSETAAHALVAFDAWHEQGRKCDDLADAFIQIVSFLKFGAPSAARKRAIKNSNL